MSMACEAWIGEGNGEERKKERSLRVNGKWGRD
jgi:hypothetical protein